eukprot:GDKI01005416.1.p1 GENE.GDKI01005416.1~~GDKI01005416.1.p1  ORF type:complete len:470 (-),score=60.58 GDKI01005416.1:428-1837(-)
MSALHLPVAGESSGKQQMVMSPAEAKLMVVTNLRAERQSQRKDYTLKCVKLAGAPPYSASQFNLGLQMTGVIKSLQHWEDIHLDDFLATTQNWKEFDIFKSLLDSDVVAFFLEGGMDVDALNERGQTPLTMAAKFGYLGTVRVLIKNGANVNSTDNDGHTPLYAAVDSGNVQVVRELLKQKANVNTQYENEATILHIAVARHRLQMSEALAKSLIDAKTNVNAQDKSGNTALHLAVQQFSAGISEVLVKRGANPDILNKEGYTPFLYACQNQDITIAQHLLEHGADVNAQTEEQVSALHIAAQYDQVEFVRSLIDVHGLQVNAKDMHGNTPLLHAANYGAHRVAKLLLEQGADPNTQNESGDTALHHLARADKKHCSTALAKLLVTFGAQKDTTNKQNETAYSIVGPRCAEHHNPWCSLQKLKSYLHGLDHPDEARDRGSTYYSSSGESEESGSEGDSSSDSGSEGEVE